jgi:hypothetical protein
MSRARTNKAPHDAAGNRIGDTREDDRDRAGDHLESAGRNIYMSKAPPAVFIACNPCR